MVISIYDSTFDLEAPFEQPVLAHKLVCNNSERISTTRRNSGGLQDYI